MAVKVLRKIFFVLSIILLAVIIIFTPLLLHLYDYSFYDRLYSENKVYEYMSVKDAEKITKQVHSFFRHENDLEKIPLGSGIPYFTQEEISHLLDVRSLIDKIYIMFYLSLFGFFLFIFLIFREDLWSYFRDISYVMISASVLVLLLLITLYFLSNNFSGLFTDFHLLFFPQGNWTFAEDALIINIFPFGFFYDFFFRLVISSLYICMAFIVICAIFLLIRKIIFSSKRKEDNWSKKDLET